MTEMTETQQQISDVCDELKALLIQKNVAYGNGLFEPLPVFSKASAIERIETRLDDKIARLAKGEAAGEDVAWDLAGYLVLLMVARRKLAGRT